MQHGEKMPTKRTALSLHGAVGAGFSLVDRKGRGWQLDVKIPGWGRVRETVGRGSREGALRRAIESIEDVERRLIAAPATFRLSEGPPRK